MNKEIIVTVKVLYLDISIQCSLSLDLTLNENIILLNELINKYINKDYLKSYNPMVSCNKTGKILKKDIPLKELNLYEGITLLFY